MSGIQASGAASVGEYERRDHLAMDVAVTASRLTRIKCDGGGAAGLKAMGLD